ncbi:MAG TPA: hypothetical protein VFF50_10660 [Candidatus Deferrimicrobiaceae bacterium]|nr:hypothetical protein [Candidatus Deferrimicrobiaceae bacterium]
MKYALNLSEKIDVSAPSASGAMIGAPQPVAFVAWQPSTWPAVPAVVDETFINHLKRIFEESILLEIRNVIDDAQENHGDLQHRGHVIAIALMCALDAIASYGYRNHHVGDFIKAHFRADYHAFADAIYQLHRNSLVHSWNLFEATIYPDHTKIKLENGAVGTKWEAPEASAFPVICQPLKRRACPANSFMLTPSGSSHLP